MFVWDHACFPFSPHHGGALREPRIEPPRAAPLACAVGGSARPGPAVSPVYTGAYKCLADGTHKNHPTYFRTSTSPHSCCVARGGNYSDFPCSDGKFAVNKKNVSPKKLHACCFCMCEPMHLQPFRGGCVKCVMNWCHFEPSGT